VAYRCRAYPNPEQQALLRRTFGCVRLVWNKTLAERRVRYATEGKSTSYAETDRTLTEWKKADELAFLNEVSAVPLQQVLRHQHAAFTNFYADRAGYPRFKSRSARQAAHFTRAGFRMRDGELFLAKTSTPLRFVSSFPGSNPVELNPTMVVVSLEQDGRWYVTFAVETADPAPLAPAGRVVGLDLGLKDLVVTSDGERIANPKHLERKAKNLARYQRRMSRCRPGSKNRAKAGRKVAAAHREVRDARSDQLHKVTTRLVREHDVIVIEDLAPANMVKNRHLAKSIHDASWGEFRRQLEYKARWAGRRLIVIDRFYPSSKICSGCGYLLTELSLSTRAWTCPACRTRHDRDHNAAKNILAAGRVVAVREYGDACGADVIRQGASLPSSVMKQEPSPALRA
jgi:putative transposase